MVVTAELLNRFSIFETAPGEIIRTIVKQAQIAPYAPGEIIVPIGQPFTFFGLFLEGEAGAYVGEADGEPRCIEDLRAGSTIGEMALMTGLVSPVDIIAARPCRVLLIPEEVFQRWIQLDPVALQKFSKRIALRSMRIEQDRVAHSGASLTDDMESDPYGLNLRPEKPQKILVINLRSGSLKYRFFDTDDESKNVEGQVEWIGRPNAVQTHATSHGETTYDLGEIDHRQALEIAMERLTDPKIGVIGSPAEITAVGQRVLWGGDKYSTAALIDDEVLQHIHDHAGMAPWHMPLHALAIEWVREVLPDVPQVAVFDTAFHQTMPDYAYRYALPESLYAEDGLRRYGFHGPSHQYVGLMAATYLKQRFSRLKMITCHLGEGASICAIDHGRSIDTSMGMTPTAGLPMVTRSGDIDPSIVTYLMRKGMSADEIDHLLNRESGMKGISGLSGDTREIPDAANAGDPRAMLAAEVFTYSVRKYLGAYYAALGGLDVLVFTGGIGENTPGLRSMACQDLWSLGILLDAVKNRAVYKADHGVVDLSHPDSKVKILVIHSDASRMIARETIRILGYQDLTRRLQASQIPIPIGVSAHHIHLSQEDVERLFGEGHQLTPRSPLSQPGQFACEEQLKLIGPRGSIDRVRVLGPVRDRSQVEISRTEGYALGINAPVRMSGDLEGTPGVILEGPVGQVEITDGVIYALRHIHMTPTDAYNLGLKNGDVVRLRVEGDRELIFGDVAVRVSPRFKLEFHLDTDEANAAQVNNGDIAYLEGIQQRGNRG